MEQVSIDKCIKEISCFARTIRQNTDKTPSELYKITNYNKYYRDITLEQIARTIMKEDSIVDEWLVYTEDKRCTPAWGLKKKSDNLYVVFYMSDTGSYDCYVSSSDRYNACALMVKMEMEDFRRFDKI